MPMSLLTKINLWLCATFLVFLAAALLLTRMAMREDARGDAIEEARLLMDSAQAARDYTASEIEPVLDAKPAPAKAPGGKARTVFDVAAPTFHPQTIPAYAATQVFESLRRKRPQYAYREATLNATNPRDRAAGWEVDVIDHFRNDPKAQELVNERATEMGPSLYLAKPIRVEDSECLVCHDTAAAAPPAVLRQYGSANGFGWHLHETVGAQIVSAPLDEALAGADRVILVVAGVLTALFVLLFVVVNLVVRAVVLRPIATLARAAESISTGHPVDVNLNVPGHDEISALCRAFDRMKTSIDKSMALLRAAR
jgi:protein-histidine pros-kinase